MNKEYINFISSHITWNKIKYDSKYLLIYIILFIRYVFLYASYVYKPRLYEKKNFLILVIFQVLWAVHCQGLKIDCWSHIHLTADRGKQIFNQAHRILLVLLDF